MVGVELLVVVQLTRRRRMGLPRPRLTRLPVLLTRLLPCSRLGLVHVVLMLVRMLGLVRVLLMLMLRVHVLLLMPRRRCRLDRCLVRVHRLVGVERRCHRGVLGVHRERLGLRELAALTVPGHRRIGGGAARVHVLVDHGGMLLLSRRRAGRVQRLHDGRRVGLAFTCTRGRAFDSCHTHTVEANTVSH